MHLCTDRLPSKTEHAYGLLLSLPSLPPETEQRKENTHTDRKSLLHNWQLSGMIRKRFIFTEREREREAFYQTISLTYNRSDPNRFKIRKYKSEKCTV